MSCWRSLAKDILAISMSLANDRRTRCGVVREWVFSSTVRVAWHACGHGKAEEAESMAPQAERVTHR